jgi:hypothetical protein
MQRLAVGEIAVGAVERETRRAQPANAGIGAAPFLAILLARRYHDDLVAAFGEREQFAVDVGSHATTGRGVECADVDDLHAATLVSTRSA